MKRRRCALLFLLSLSVPALVRAQSGAVSGKVLAADSITPVAGAEVRIIGVGRVTTKLDGTYRLIGATGTHDIVVTARGFRSARRALPVADSDTVVDFMLVPNPIPLSEVVTIGRRADARTSTETPVPVDVLTSTSLAETGLVETWQALQRLIPSVNVPHIPLGDNHARPITLRGLFTDQVLILVDGKRRHSSAVLTGGPVTSGTAATDLSTIPSGAIDRIEVLRDGAAARYGSDAIAGVINIVLKSGEVRETVLSLSQVYSIEGGRTFRDGDVVNVRSSYGRDWGNGASVTLSGEFRDRGRTNRAYPDARRQYFVGDPRNEDPPRISSHEGNGEIRDLIGLAKAFLPLRGGTELYVVGGTRHRDAASPTTFFRRALDDRTVRAIHPDGYLSRNESEYTDYSALLGSRRTSGVWQWDVSSGYGRNVVRQYVHNTNNVTLGNESPTDFYAGSLSSSQWISNLDVTRAPVLLNPFEVSGSAGLELRQDGYRIRQGEPDSYRDGGVRILDGPSTGRLGAVGSQGNPGFQPVDEVDADRSNLAAYIELEGSTEKTLLGVVGQLEKHGAEPWAMHGKIASRVQLLPALAVRGALASGFRAPSLAQEFHSTTNGILRLVNGVSTAFVIRHLPVHSEAARLLGAVPLRPETATHFSGGLVLDLATIATVTADYFTIDVDDRIVRTNEFVGPQVEEIFNNAGMRGIIGGRYFGNVIDTETRGLDIVVNRASRLGRGDWRFIGGFSAVRTRVTRVSPPPEEFSGFDTVLFNRAQQGAIERGQPQRTILLTNNYRIGPWSINLHNQRFGEAALLDIRDPAEDQTVSAKWLTDINVSFRVRRDVSVSVAAANLFDIYPDEWNDFPLGVEATGMSNSGIFRYPGGISPFGMNGRTLAVHLSWR